MFINLHLLRRLSALTINATANENYNENQEKHHQNDLNITHNSPNITPNITRQYIDIRAFSPKSDVSDVFFEEKH